MCFTAPSWSRAITVPPWIRPPRIRKPASSSPKAPPPGTTRLSSSIRLPSAGATSTTGDQICKSSSPGGPPRKSATEYLARTESTTRTTCPSLSLIRMSWKVAPPSSPPGETDPTVSEPLIPVRIRLRSQSRARPRPAAVWLMTTAPATPATHRPAALNTAQMKNRDAKLRRRPRRAVPAAPAGPAVPATPCSRSFFAPAIVRTPVRSKTGAGSAAS